VAKGSARLGVDSKLRHSTCQGAGVAIEAHRLTQWADMLAAERVKRPLMQGAGLRRSFPNTTLQKGMSDLKPKHVDMTLPCNKIRHQGTSSASNKPLNQPHFM
jgi:hypothetical protein